MRAEINMKIIKTLGCAIGLLLLAACQSTTATKPELSLEETLSPVTEEKLATEEQAKAEVETESAQKLNPDKPKKP